MVRDPKDAAIKAVVTDRFDDGLHRYAGLSGSGRHADHSAPLSAVVITREQHKSDVLDDGLLIVMKRRQRVGTFHLHVWRKASVPRTRPFGGESERVDELDRWLRPRPSLRRIQMVQRVSTLAERVRAMDGDGCLGNARIRHLVSVLNHGEKGGRQAVAQSFYAYRCQEALGVRRVLPYGGALFVNFLWCWVQIADRSREPSQVLLLDLGISKCMNARK